jgi:hypothetical protein
MKINKDMMSVDTKFSLKDNLKWVGYKAVTNQGAVRFLAFVYYGSEDGR